MRYSIVLVNWLCFSSFLQSFIHHSKTFPPKQMSKVFSPTQLFQYKQQAALDQLFEEGLNTCEDAYLHFRRYFSSFYRLAQTKFRNITDTDSTDPRPRVVVVGSGWGAHALLKIIETEDYHVICVSPRPYFIFTPMLAACTTGTVEYRSIVEPIRVSNPFVDFVEGEVIDIDPYNKRIKVTSALQSLLPTDDNNALTSTSLALPSDFSISYDKLIYAAGSQVADFGTPGVKENCVFIKEIDDVRKIKKKILKTFELASLPTTPVDMLSSLLTFVVVGGGPTGVEFAVSRLPLIFALLCLLTTFINSLLQCSFVAVGRAS